MNRSAAIGFVLGIVIPPVFVTSYASVVSLSVDRDLDAWARHDAALDMTRSLFVSLDLYRRDQQRVPPLEIGLAALVPDYIRAIPLDPWGNAFVYQTRGADWADVISLGADGAPGGSELATDVSARYGSPGTATSQTLVRVLFAILLLMPGITYAATHKWPGAAYALAGMALFWAWTVASTVGPNAAPSAGLLGAFAAIVIALSGTVLVLRRLHGGVACALTGALCCLIAAAAIVA